MAAETASFDGDKFRLRKLVGRLIDMDEVDIHEEPRPMAEIAPIVEASKKAVLFKNAGPERNELVAAVSVTTRRLAASFDVPESQLRAEYMRRMATPQKTFEVPSKDAPVHEVVLTGNDIDLTKLPFHVQHEYDGAPYISSGIDFVVDPATKRSNVGCRRLMLRGKDICGFNLTAPSDLRQIYLGCVSRGEKLPIAFTIGSHPLDTMAAASRTTGQEIESLGKYRGAPLPVVKCATNDLYVPADAEVVLEGYVDERGYVDNEGPYGEYMGYYGPMHGDPLFHVTAITRRKDVLYQSIKHGIGKMLGYMDGSAMSHLQAECRALQLLRQAGLDAVEACVPAGPGVGAHMRVSIRKKSDADARTAIAVILGNMLTVKHVYVCDEDIDVHRSEEVEWAMASRFQADKDIVVLQNMQFMPMDLSAHERGISAKAGFDLTFPYPRPNKVTYRVPEAPKIGGPARFQTVRQALEAGPMHFARLMSTLGSRDGREIVLELERLRAEGVLERNEDGEYFLKRH